MPDEVDVWNSYVGFPNPFLRVVLEVFTSEFFVTLKLFIFGFSL